MGPRKQGITQETKLCETLIEATHLLWTKGIFFEHDRKLYGLQEVENIQLKTAIRNQYKLSTSGLKISDKSRFKNLMLKLWSNNGAYIRS